MFVFVSGELLQFLAQEEKRYVEVWFLLLCSGPWEAQTAATVWSFARWVTRVTTHTGTYTWARKLYQQVPTKGGPRALLTRAKTVFRQESAPEVNLGLAWESSEKH